MVNIKTMVKYLFLRGLFCIPHNNIYEFHHISSCPEEELSSCKLDTDIFYDFINRHGPYISVEELIRQKEKNGVAAITFDDGLEDVFTIAYPFLKGKNIPFTAFILSEKIGKKGYLSLSQLRTLMDDPLVTIGSHGTDHSKLSEVEDEKQRFELMESKKRIEFLMGHPCELFAYPFGLYNDTTLEIMKESKYRYAFAVKGRPVYDLKANRFEIPRMSIENNTVFFYDHS